jgi:hypothetical protein
MYKEPGVWHDGGTEHGSGYVRVWRNSLRHLACVGTLTASGRWVSRDKRWQPSDPWNWAILCEGKASRLLADCQVRIAGNRYNKMHVLGRLIGVLGARGHNSLKHS